MASSVLDVGAPARARPLRGDDAPHPAAPLRRVPVTALAGGVLAVFQAVGLLAAGLTWIDVLLRSPVRPPGAVTAGGLAVLAGWVLLSAAGGAALVDGADRRLVARSSLAELLVVASAGTLAAVPVPAVPTPGVPLPVLLTAAVFLPVAGHRALCTLTLGVLALGLGALVVLAPAQPAVDAPAAGAVHHS